MKKPRIKIAAEYARLIQPFISKEETRYYLNGFHVEPRKRGGVYIVATDGHRMGVFWDEHGICQKTAIIQLPKSVLDACKPRKDGIANFLFIDGDGSEATATVACEDRALATITVPGVLIDGSFPAWERVLPVHDPKVSGAATMFNSQYYSDFGSAAGRKGAGVWTWARDEKSPALVRVGTRRDFFGVLMPMRSDETGYPAWIEAPKPEPSAVAAE
jgi:hypothetical protein